jgi:hypothetical protein
MNHHIYARLKCTIKTISVANIANEKTQSGIIEPHSHLMLFKLVTAENDDSSWVVVI